MGKYDDIRLGIALPCTQSHVPAGFLDSLFCMNRPLPFRYLRPSSAGTIDTVRNELCDLAVIRDCTHLLMMDTDQVYPDDTLVKLLDHDLDFVAGKVHRRHPPYDPILLRGAVDSFEKVPDEEWEKGGLVEVDATGMGCVMMKVEALKKVPRPWFKFDWQHKPTPIGEDIWFWKQVKEAGFKIFTDCSIRIGHLAQLMITEESYWAYKFSEGDRTSETDSVSYSPNSFQPSFSQ